MYALAPDISTVDTEYGIALLHQARGEYWNLNPSGAIVLRAALTGGPESAVAALVEAYGVDTPTATHDVQEVLAGLLAAGILLPDGEAA
ncbi:lasso peptide biosynthesis PqqD family chaperone [Nonomuraea sp. NPDC050790]|uniref:lasso peptide biosynthesis PqqD family chaperone n=1 Tax=Nonomuraea sp. NPDC050790 TaxID=3364371 RepID=UPI0037BBAF5E